MSLAEFPLNLIPIRSVELGLDGDDGPGIVFLAGGSFILGVHDERSTGAEGIGRRRAGSPGETRLIPQELISSKDTRLQINRVAIHDTGYLHIVVVGIRQGFTPQYLELPHRAH